MFCNNCGNQAEENQKFCTKCGNELIKSLDPLKCKKCGSIVDLTAKFCENCGEEITRDSSNKRFCQFCGAEILADECFCKNCGKVIKNSDDFISTIAEIANKTIVTGKEKFSDIFNSSLFDGSVKSKELLGKLFLCACYALLLIFCFVPAIRIEVPIASLFSTELRQLDLSFGNMLGNKALTDVLSIAMSTDEYEAIAFILKGFSLGIVVLSLSAFLLYVCDIFKKQNIYFWLKLGLPLLMLLAVVSLLIFIGGIVQEFNTSLSMEAVNYNLTFGGWIFMLLLIAILVYSIYIHITNSKTLGAKNG